MSEIAIRPALADDAAAVAEIYLTSFKATYDFPLAHTEAQVHTWIRHLIAAQEVWVAVDSDDAIVGMMKVVTGELGQLYVRPDRLGEGIGGALLEVARKRSPDGLALYAFQANARARRFYERHGFLADRFSDGSDSEEGQPDVRYVWRSDKGA